MLKCQKDRHLIPCLHRIQVNKNIKLIINCSTSYALRNRNLELTTIARVFFKTCSQIYAISHPALLDQCFMGLSRTLSCKIKICIVMYSFIGHLQFNKWNNSATYTIFFFLSTHVTPSTTCCSTILRPLPKYNFSFVTFAMVFKK